MFIILKGVTIFSMKLLCVNHYVWPNWHSVFLRNDDLSLSVDWFVARYFCRLKRVLKGRIIFGADKKFQNSHRVLQLKVIMDKL